jgi:hypothetical protein
MRRRYRQTATAAGHLVSAAAPAIAHAQRILTNRQRASASGSYKSPWLRFSPATNGNGNNRTGELPAQSLMKSLKTRQDIDSRSAIWGFGAARRRVDTYFLALVTFVLGAAFLYLEVREFADMIARGATPQRSAFLSAFFTLVGCHGLHAQPGWSGWS